MARFSPLRFFLDRMLGLGIGIVLFLAGLVVYNTYKYFFWPHVQAVVTSVEPVCVYAKKSGRRSKIEYLRCDDGTEAARLVADGYALRPDKEALLRAVFEAEPGRKTDATLRPWWVSVATLRPGSMIQIRYSPDAPNEAELVTGADKVPVVILGFFLGALLLACLLAVVTYEGDEQATSG